MTKIPAPELIGEPITGAIYALPRGKVLVIGDPPSTLANREVIFMGDMLARYAIPLYSPPDTAVIPGLLVGERGGFVVGREAWDFIEENFQRFPRADVIGRKLDGSEAQVFLRELDLGRSIRVVLYEANCPERKPLAEVANYIKGTNAPDLPDLLARYLPIVSDLNGLLKSEMH